MNVFEYRKAFKKAVLENDIDAFKALLTNLVTTSHLSQDRKLLVFNSTLVLVGFHTRREMLQFIFESSDRTFDLMKQFFLNPEQAWVRPDLLFKALNNLLDDLFEMTMLGNNRVNAKLLMDVLPVKTKFNFITITAQKREVNPFTQAVLNGEIELVHSMLFGLSVTQQCSLIEAGLLSASLSEMIKILYNKILNLHGVVLTEQELLIWNEIKDIQEAHHFIFTLAIKHNAIDLVKSLLKNTRVTDERTLKEWDFGITLAARLGYNYVFEAIFVDLPECMLKKISYGAALIESARNGDLVLIQTIFDALEWIFLEETELEEIIQYVNENGETAFIAAARNNRAAIIYKLHEQISTLPLFFRCDFFSYRDPNDKTALIYALENPNNESMLFAIYTLWKDYFDLNMLNSIQKTMKILFDILARDDQVHFFSSPQFGGDALLKKVIERGHIEVVYSSFSNVDVGRALLWAIEANQIESTQFLLLQISASLDLDKVKILNSSLILAAGYGFAEIIDCIFTSLDLTPEIINICLNYIDEAVGLEDSVLMQAARNNHLNVIQVIFNRLKDDQTQIETMLERENAQGETAFIVAACNNHVNIIQALFGCVKNNSLLLKVLNHKDKQGQTVLTHAFKKIESDPRLLKIIFTVFKKELYQAIEDSNASIVQGLLDAMSYQQIRFLFLQTQKMQGNTFLMLASKSGNLDIVKLILNNLTFPQQEFLLDQENNEGQAAVTIAKKMKFNDITNFIYFYSSNEIINDSASRSLVALTLRYLDFDQADKDILIQWIQAPSQEQDTQAMQSVIKKMSTQTQLKQLVEDYTMGIIKWCNFLTFSNSRALTQQEVAKFLRQFIPFYSQGKIFWHPSTKLTVTQVLVLTWIAMHDETQYDSHLDINMQLEERKEIFISVCSHLRCALEYSEIQESFMVFDGFFANVLVSSLSALHPDVNALIVNTSALEVSAKYLLVSQFNCTDYTANQLEALRHRLVNHQNLTLEVKQKLKPKLKAALHAKFDKFIVKRFVQEEDINSVIDSALTLYSFHKKTIQNEVQKKLTSTLGENTPINPIVSRKKYR